MIRQCWVCGNCGDGYRRTSLGYECPGCYRDSTEFDADELGLDPETDNQPDSPGRTA